MGLTFGHRPFDFSDFFQLIMSGELDFANLNYADVMMKSVEAGFKHIEITGDLPDTLPGILTPEKIDQLLEIKKKEKLTYSVHLPLWGIEPAAFSGRIREGSIQAFVDCIELTSPLDPLCYVIHPTGNLTVEFITMGLPELATGIIIQQFTNHAENAIKEVLKRTKIDSRLLAVENIEFPFEAMEPLIENHDLSICFDTGHLMAGFSGEMDTMTFVEKYYERIIELHLHDGKKPRIDHKPLGTQELPIKELLTFLNEKKFTGPFVFELSLSEALQSLDYIKINVPNVIY
ncbi:MAG: cobamide remodeling phosphodiesterase CbiR [Candidatus Heimdallarchaeota archaeon]